MNPVLKDQCRILRDEVWRTPWGTNEAAGGGRAYLMSALLIGLDGETTLYHYPAFYNMHHALELLIKGVFELDARGHELSKLAQAYSGVSGFLNPAEIEDIQLSDELNRDVGQLRYYSPPHKVFDWELFYRLGCLGKRLIEEGHRRHYTPSA